MSEIQHHLDALLLAVASSTDNFTVGLSVGVTRKPLPLWANGIISVCNAGGAWVAGKGGLLLIQSLSAYGGNEKQAQSPSLPLYLSALAFGVLAASEFYAYYTSKNDSKEPESTKRKAMTNWWEVFKLAIPMTLNNLAGGVAGGAAGLMPAVSAFYALVASLVTMAVGYHVGIRLGKALLSSKDDLRDGKDKPASSLSQLLVDPTLLSAILLGMLFATTLREAMTVNRT